MSKSFFLYIHKDLSGNPDFRKLGKAMTPYSANRSRQKNCSERFHLEHLWFGDPTHITFLEEKIKESLYHQSVSYLKGIPSATEIFKIPENKLIEKINYLIRYYNLNVWKQRLSEPYQAANSKECPFGIPIETKSYDFLMAKLKSYSSFVPKKKVSATSQFKKLFEYLDDN